MLVLSTCTRTLGGNFGLKIQRMQDNQQNLIAVDPDYLNQTLTKIMIFMGVSCALNSIACIHLSGFACLEDPLYPYRCSNYHNLWDILPGVIFSGHTRRPQPTFTAMNHKHSMKTQ